MADEGKGEQREDVARPVQPGGWRLVDFEALKNPPTAVAAFVYLVATLFGLAVLVLVGFGIVAGFRIAQETATGEFKDRIEAAKVFFPILLALVGGPLLIWRVITAHIQAQATRHQAETGRQGHYTSLFTKAIELLGATRETTRLGNGDVVVTRTEPNLEVRIGGIYALERIARESEPDRWATLEVLCAYIRSLHNRELADDPLRPREDVEIALEVLGRHTRDPAEDTSDAFNRLNLSDANLEGASFAFRDYAGFGFARANLRSAIFHGADLRGAMFAWTDLGGARFDNALLEGAVFVGCDLSDTSGITQAQLDTTIADAGTTLPKGTSRPTSWADRRLAEHEWVTIVRRRSRSRQSFKPSP